MKTKSFFITALYAMVVCALVVIFYMSDDTMRNIFVGIGLFAGIALFTAAVLLRGVCDRIG